MAQQAPPRCGSAILPAPPHRGAFRQPLDHPETVASAPKSARVLTAAPREVRQLSVPVWCRLAGRSQRLGILVGANYATNANGTATLSQDMFDALSDVPVADTDVAGALGQAHHAAVNHSH